MEDSRKATALASDSVFIVRSTAIAWDSVRGADLFLNPPQWEWRGKDCLKGESAGVDVTGFGYGHRWAAGGYNVLWGDASTEKKHWRDAKSQTESIAIDFY